MNSYKMCFNDISYPDFLEVIHSTDLFQVKAKYSHILICWSQQEEHFTVTKRSKKFCKSSLPLQTLLTANKIGQNLLHVVTNA